MLYSFVFIPRHHFKHLSRNANDSTSWTSTSIACLLRIGVSALSKIVSSVVNNNGSLWYVLVTNSFRGIDASIRQ